jgi:hypothetical protein
LLTKTDQFLFLSLSRRFDGYEGEETIILDDLDSDCLGHYLKIWMDKWSCKGETKGGTIHLQHHRFIVTSNYKIEDLIKDPVMAEAIRKRCEVKHFSLGIDKSYVRPLILN